MAPRTHWRLVAGLAATGLAAGALVGGTSAAQAKAGPQTPSPTAVGYGGAVSSVDGDLAIESLQEMPAMLADSPAVFGRRYPVWLLGVFASCATLLAAIGLFGVLSYVVGERTHELGIRIALGASPREVVLDVARRALPAVLGGLGVGVLGSALAAGVLRGLLFEARGMNHPDYPKAPQKYYRILSAEDYQRIDEQLERELQTATNQR